MKLEKTIVIAQFTYNDVLAALQEWIKSKPEAEGVTLRGVKICNDSGYILEECDAKFQPPSAE